jgi:hypothetical protein
MGNFGRTIITVRSAGQLTKLQRGVNPETGGAMPPIVHGSLAGVGSGETEATWELNNHSTATPDGVKVVRAHEGVGGGNWHLLG